MVSGWYTKILMAISEILKFKVRVFMLTDNGGGGSFDEETGRLFFQPVFEMTAVITFGLK